MGKGSARWEGTWVRRFAGIVDVVDRAAVVGAAPVAVEEVLDSAAFPRDGWAAVAFPEERWWRPSELAVEAIVTSAAERGAAGVVFTNRPDVVTASALASTVAAMAPADIGVAVPTGHPTLSTTFDTTVAWLDSCRGCEAVVVPGTDWAAELALARRLLEAHDPACGCSLARVVRAVAAGRALATEGLADALHDHHVAAIAARLTGATR